LHLSYDGDRIVAVNTKARRLRANRHGGFDRQPVIVRSDSFQRRNTRQQQAPRANRFRLASAPMARRPLVRHTFPSCTTSQPGVGCLSVCHWCRCRRYTCGRRPARRDRPAPSGSPISIAKNHLAVSSRLLIGRHPVRDEHLVAPPVNAGQALADFHAARTVVGGRAGACALAVGMLVAGPIHDATDFVDRNHLTRTGGNPVSPGLFHASGVDTKGSNAKRSDDGCPSEPVSSLAGTAACTQPS
jgi:hypothetical protein